MKKYRSRSLLAFVLIAYLAMSSLLRGLYVHALRMYGVPGPPGVELSTGWWVVNLLYLVGDASLLAAAIWIAWRRCLIHGEEVPFSSGISEILLFVSWGHFTLLVFEYPVSSRLQGVGLGTLEGISAAMSVVSAIPILSRAIRSFF